MDNFKRDDYLNDLKPSWCKGCSFYGVLSALTRALASQSTDPSKVNIISGIGCSSRMSLYMSTRAMHTLHGRAIPVAIGARLANPENPVIVIGGDGDLFSIGAGHFLHAARINADITVICLNNRMYAMTKNQSSPTSAKGHTGSLTPFGKESIPLNLPDLAMAGNASFISRTFAGSSVHMQEMFSEAFSHQGFSFVEVITPCLTFDKKESLSRLSKRIVDINRDLHHDPCNREEAIKLAESAMDYDSGPSAKVGVGVFWSCSTQ